MITRVTAAEARRRRRGLTDFALLDAMTDADIVLAVAADPDVAPLDIDWSKATLVLPSSQRKVGVQRQRE